MTGRRWKDEEPERKALPGRAGQVLHSSAVTVCSESKLVVNF